MATPVIEEMARAIRAEINNQEWTDSEELARSALKALEENITDEMVAAAANGYWRKYRDLSAESPAEEPDAGEGPFGYAMRAMLHAAREE